MKKDDCLCPECGTFHGQLPPPARRKNYRTTDQGRYIVVCGRCLTAGKSVQHPPKYRKDQRKLPFMENKA